MPTLKTARLALAAPLIHKNMDLGYYLRWLSNEKVVRYSEQRHLTHTNETQYEYITSFVDTEDYFWEIQRNSNPIGSISAYRDLPNRIANIGIMIGDTNLWGQGYASEAWEGVCTFLFEEGCRKIEAGCMAHNTAMRILLERQGFLLEASIDSHFLLDGKPEDKVIYGKHQTAKVIHLKKSGSDGISS